MNLKDIKIRKMTDNDIDFIIQANKEVHEASNQTSEINKFRERIINDILSDNPKATIIVAEYDNQLIGMALYSTVYFADDGEILWLSNIFVEKEYRNKSVAKIIVDYLKQVCKDEGYYAICGAVEESNENSINFFDSISGKWLNEFKIVVIK